MSKRPVIEKDFEHTAKSQEARDLAVLSRIKTEFINPLVDELNTIIEDYGNMPEPEKFVEIMRVNAAKYAPHGYALPLDFGDIDGEVVCSGLVFSGSKKGTYGNLYECRAEGEVEDKVDVYSEKFPQLREGLFLHARKGPLERLPPQELDRCLMQYRNEYSKLPPTFKIGVVAQLISQSVLVPYSEACKFAAGWVEDIEPRRWLAHQRRTKARWSHGWILAIRDQKPENELMRHCARALRAASPDTHDPLLYRFFGCTPAYSAKPHEQVNERSRRERTNALVEFIDVILPSKGYYVGRRGEGERISFAKAQDLFESEHPDYHYYDVNSFRNAYYNARKAREKG